MASLIGAVLIAQEGRLQLLGDDGAAHLFLLSPSAAADSSQMAGLAARQARVEITYEAAPHMIALRALKITPLSDAAS